MKLVGTVQFRGPMVHLLRAESDHTGVLKLLHTLIAAWGHHGDVVTV